MQINITLDCVRLGIITNGLKSAEEEEGGGVGHKIIAYRYDINSTMVLNKFPGAVMSLPVDPIIPMPVMFPCIWRKRGRAASAAAVQCVS